ncbi:MAG: winged helix-turn-helix domain-containing protein [Nanoarchaeota archaeon]
MRKRERLQVIYDILKAIGDKNGKIKPTHILYKSNLSHQMMEEYLKELISGNFIQETQYNGSKSYSLTQKGFDYLNKYQVINEFIDSFGLN